MRRVAVRMGYDACMASTYSSKQAGVCPDCGRSYGAGAEVGDVADYSDPVCAACWDATPTANRE